MVIIMLCIALLFVPTNALNTSCSEDKDCSSGCCSLFTDYTNQNLLRYSCQPIDVCNIRKNIGTYCESSLSCLTKCCYLNRCTSTETCFTYVLQPVIVSCRLWISIGFGIISVVEWVLVGKIISLRKKVKKSFEEEKTRINELAGDPRNRI